ncbi:MAG: hypothetical protein OXM02_14860, partial [Bacteroidota bacterium]|nr:hypothetical protein [Bacteroidota bacterium]
LHQDAPRPVPQAGALQGTAGDHFASIRATTNLIRQKAKAAMVELGRRYLEISQFEHVPGIGACVQCVPPHRFAD